jgi:hypothetical protein
LEFFFYISIKKNYTSKTIEVIYLQIVRERGEFSAGIRQIPDLGAAKGAWNDPFLGTSLGFFIVLETPIAKLVVAIGRDNIGRIRSRKTEAAKLLLLLLIVCVRRRGQVDTGGRRSRRSRRRSGSRRRCSGLLS